MLVPSNSTRRSLSLSRINTSRHSRLLARYLSARPFITVPTRRPLVTPPELLPRRMESFQTPHRPLATAIDHTSRQDDMSFDQIQKRSPNSHVPSLPRARPYELRVFDPSSPLLVKQGDDPFPRTRQTPHGIPGGIDEMLSMLDACYLVNKLDRAALVLERLINTEAIAKSDLIILHNRYLRAAIDRAFEEPHSQWAQSLHKWYEVYIRKKGIPQTSETIACMLKVSILSAQGLKLKRLVNRYMEMLPGDSIYQILSEVEILNQQDFGIITSMYKPASDLVFEYQSMPPHEQDTQTLSDHEATEARGFKADTTITPEVLAVTQKGLGLKTLRGVLSFFSSIDGKDLSKLPVADRREIQSRLEKDCVDAAINRWREENQALLKMGRNSSFSTNALNSQLYEWHVSLESKMKAEFMLFKDAEARTRKKPQDMDRCLYAPYMTQSTPARLAAVTIMTVINCLASRGTDKGVALNMLLSNIGKAVEEDAKHQSRHKQFESRKAKAGKPPKRGASKAQEPSPSSNGQATIATEADPRVVDPPVYDLKVWPVLIRTKIGAALLSAMMDLAKVNVIREHPDTKVLVSQTQPALAHAIMYRKGKKSGTILPNKFLVEMMKREPRGDFMARHLPMLVEPEPWSDFDKGGFLASPAQLIRIKQGEKDQRIYADAALERGDLEQVTKGLDVLGRTPWQVNKPVLNVMLEAWNTGEKLANIPPLDPQIPVPPEPELSDDPMQRRYWLRRVKEVENEKSGLHSERCFMNFQLEIARAFRDQTFYFPHNMDFRGRAYPVPTYLNHMGADHVRGILRFGVGKELGPSGLRWLKVHLANVYGFDKASLKEREQFADDKLSQILDSATNPLNGNRWWLQAEDPWQCLAVCFELKAALESPEPTRYISHLPVHQDGTCNGLQHYAALGGDIWGARQVNLEPGDRPADVYSAVADLVKESVARDVKDDNFLAKAVDGKITRKVVKQTVMTNVYGVTFVGAKAQVLKQLDAAHPNLQTESGIPATLLASYVATNIFKALSTMFRGAHDIQYWLGECAGRVCRALTPEQLDRIAAGTPESGNKSKITKPRRNAEDLLGQFRSTIVWTTPLRMPVVQPYRKSGIRKIETCMQTLSLQVPERSDPVNRRKQLQAFPPNFIHSLDASHMLLSALECDDLGLSFAAVHDSFWTHAGDVDVMNRVLRDSFIRIHSEDVIERLAAEFKARYRGSIYLAQVEKGSVIEKKISELRRKQRLSMHEELLQERERLRLLESSKAEEVEQGQKMVTPASLFEEFSISQPLSAKSETDAVALGNISDENIHASDEVSGDESTTASGVVTSEHDLMTEAGLERLKEAMSMTDFEVKLKGTTKKEKASPRPGNTQIWLPLAFPDIPKKGEFDVTRLKGSQYFFS